jgi:dihydrofolate reductase
MRKIIVSEFVSVDGVFEDPGGSENFTNSGWQRPFMSKLKNEDGKDILVYGSGQLTRFLLKENLVDILVLMVHPIILGEGKKLLDSAAKKQLKLLDIKKFQNGTFVLEYSPLS